MSTKLLRPSLILLALLLPLGQCNFVLGQNTPSETTTSSIDQLYAPFELNNRGLKLLNEGKAQESIQQFEAAIKSTPKSEFYYNLGVAHHKLNNLDEAERALKQALALDMKNWEAWRELARVLTDAQKFIEAKTAYENALKNQTRTKPVPALGLGSVDIASLGIHSNSTAYPTSNISIPAMTESPPAVAEAKAVAEPIPTIPEPAKAIAETIKSGPPPTTIVTPEPSKAPAEAIATAEPMKATAEPIAVTRPVTAEPLTANKSVSDTVKDIAQPIVEAPKEEIIPPVAEALKAEPAQAIAESIKSEPSPEVSATPDDSESTAETIAYANNTVTKNTEIAEVEEPVATTTAAREFPGQGNRHQWAKACALYDQASILFHEGKIDHAIMKYRAAIIIYPYDADFFHNLGLALKKKGDYRRAVQAYRQAIELSPDDWDTWYNLGSALFELERHKEASDAFLKANKLNPSAQGKDNINSYLAQLKDKSIK